MATSSDSTSSEVEILMMGLTGDGKSATGNSILGRKQFVSCGGWSSVTKEFHVGTAQINNRIIKVVDIPGFKDTAENSSEDKIKLVVNELSRAMLQVRNGFHAVLLVYPYNKRMTQDDKTSLIEFLNLFDQNAFKEHGILLLTYGDSYREEVGDKNVRDWIAEQGSDHQFLPAICNYRCVLFDNKTQDENIRNAQRRELMRCIDGFSGWSKYIPEICKMKGRDYDDYVFYQKELIDYETVMHELAVLGGLIWGDGSNENLARVNKQGHDVYELLLEKKIYKSKNVPEMEMLERCVKLFDGSMAKRMEFNDNAIKPIQLKVEQKMEKTKYWQDMKTLMTKNRNKEERGIQNFNFLVVGRSGRGLSATCKSIVRGGDIVSRGGFNSVSQGLEKLSGVIGRKSTVTVVVTDSIFKTTPAGDDPDLNPNSETQRLKLSVANAFEEISLNHFDAILMVMSYGSRFSESDIKTVEILDSVFGSRIINSSGIIVMTGGDSFIQDFNQKDFTIHHWFKQRSGYQMALFRTCKERVVLFDNASDNKQIKEHQLRQLMSYVSELPRSYRYKDFCDMLDSSGDDFVKAKIQKSSKGKATESSDKGKKINPSSSDERLEAIIHDVESAKNEMREIMEEAFEKQTKVLDNLLKKWGSE